MDQFVSSDECGSDCSCQCHQPTQAEIDKALIASTWNHPEARLILPELVKEFGQPTFDVRTPGGEVSWTPAGIFGTAFLEDLANPHHLLCNHCDALIGAFYIFIKPEYMSSLFAIDPAIGYQTLRYIFIVQCHNLRWITVISYVALRFLDSLDFPKCTKCFSIRKAQSMIIQLLKIIDCDDKLYCEIKEQIKKYVRRNQTKYNNLIFRKCGVPQLNVV